MTLGLPRHIKYTFYCAFAIAAIAALQSPATSKAATFCVAPDNACTPGHTFSDIQTALETTENDGQADTLLLGATTYSSADTFYYPGPDPLTIIGAGQGQTILTSQLNVVGAVSVEDLTIKAAMNVRAEEAHPSLHNVTVESPSPNAEGTNISGDLTASNCTYDLPGGVGLRIDTKPDHTVELIDDHITTGQGAVIALTGTSTIGNSADGKLIIRRTYINGGSGIEATNLETVVEDSLIEVTSPSSFGIDAEGLGGENFADRSASLIVRQSTIVPAFGTSANSGSIGIVAKATQRFVGEEQYGATVAADVSDSIVTLTESLLATTNVSVGIPHPTSEISVEQADIQEANSSGQGASIASGPGITSIDPGFVDPTLADYHLLWSSPLVDRDETPLAVGEESFDLEGNPRIVDGTGVGTAARDFGAYEYQRQAPLAVGTAEPTTAKVGEAVQFNGLASSDPDPGDTLTYLWEFDDGTNTAEATPMHVFETPGEHKAELTVTDPTGLTDKATVEVDVVQETTPPVETISPGPPPPGETTRSEPSPKQVGLKITGGPTGLTRSRDPSFRFSTPGIASTFECRIDQSAWRLCRPPKRYHQLALGNHVFKVKVSDSEAGVEPTEAKRSFKIVAHRTDR